jgi:formylglycine-generating enzyme required for sulfatase activity
MAPQSGEEAYDAYLAQCLEGRSEDPVTFGSRHGVSADVQARLERLHRLTHDSPSPAVAPPSAVAGTMGPDDFQLIEELGSGGMGTVWLAVQPGLGRQVALKRIRPELLTSVQTRERFAREAQVIARLQHPHIVEIHAFGERDGVPWFAMAYLPGGSLRDRLRAGAPLPWQECVSLVAGLARALAHAHAAGVIHRDVKPENVLFAADGTATLVDFGIARDDLAGGGLTQTYHGSPSYSAPEQLMGLPLDARCDVYALACVLYECLTGRAPFVGSSLEEVVRRCLSDEPLGLRVLVPSIPRDLETVVLAALRREPAERTASASELADDLEAVLAGRPIRARPPGPWRRLVRWGRGHPRMLALLGAIALTGAILAGVGWQRARARLEEGRDLVRQAQTLVEGMRPQFERGRQMSRERDRLRAMLRSHHLDDADASKLLAAEQATRLAAQERESIHHRVLTMLREAERLGASTPDIRKVRAELFGWRMWIASILKEHELAAGWRARAEAEREGSTARFESRLAFQITSDPPGAEVEIYTYVELSEITEDGERRLVPQPPRGVEWPVEPGTWCLLALEDHDDLRLGDRVVAVAGVPLEGAVSITKASGDLKRGDRLLSIAGREIRHVDDVRLDDPEAPCVFERGERRITMTVREWMGLNAPADSAQRVAQAGALPATVIRGASRVEIQLPRAPRLAPSAATTFGAGHALGQTPLDLRGFAGSRHGYLAVLRAPGCRPTMRPFQPGEGETIHVRLERPGEAPPGCVYVAASPPFWMQRSEVTMAEYLPFLNAPETRAAVESSEVPVRYPRMPSSQGRGAVLTQHTDGFWRLPDKLRPDQPVFGVSYEDANAYARWWAVHNGIDPTRVGVPRYEEWREAGGGNLGREYVYGYWFWPRWLNSNFSRPQPHMESVMSYPIDESPYGILDMGGSVMEWLDAQPANFPGVQRLGGGSWAQGNPNAFRIESGLSLPPEQATAETGFRLIVRTGSGGR